MAIRKISILACAIASAIGGAAGAQPQPDQPAPPPQPQPQPQPPPPPVAQPTPPPPPEHEVSIRELDADRPSELAFAIGIGYERPAGAGAFDLQTPNIASVRLRLVSGLTFEPTVTIANSSIDTDPGTGMTTTESITEFALGTLVRYPIIHHHHVDFEILGDIGFDVTKDDPTGADNTKTTSELELGWGIGIGYWLSHHWQLSASATNALVTFTKTSQQVSATESMSTSTTNIGITFDPTITFMIHLYN